MSLNVTQLSALSDNYIYVLSDENRGFVAVVDPSDFHVVSEFLGAKGWGLDVILNTHHHLDHVGANLQLKEVFGAQVWGPAADEKRIPGIDQCLTDGQQFSIGGHTGIFFDTPGHTKGHGAFYFPKDHFLFCGDTLFSLGCGRLFEGSPQQMWSSLLKLRALPDQTKIFCAHEYTQSNAVFACHIDPNNLELLKYQQKVCMLREAARPTVPSLMGTEKQCNPFLRADQASLKKQLGMQDKTAVEVFAFLRSQKDHYR